MSEEQTLFEAFTADARAALAKVKASEELTHRARSRLPLVAQLASLVWNQLDLKVHVEERDGVPFQAQIKLICPLVVPTGVGCWRGRSLAPLVRRARRDLAEWMLELEA